MIGGFELSPIHSRYLMNNLDWLSDALGDFEDDYVRLRFPVYPQSILFDSELLPSTANHRLPRSNRTLHPHSRLTSSRQASHDLYEHFPRLCVPTRESIYGG